MIKLVLTWLILVHYYYDCNAQNQNEKDFTSNFDDNFMPDFDFSHFFTKLNTNDDNQSIKNQPVKTERSQSYAKYLHQEEKEDIKQTQPIYHLASKISLIDDDDKNFNRQTNLKTQINFKDDDDEITDQISQRMSGFTVKDPFKAPFGSQNEFVSFLDQAAEGVFGDKLIPEKINSEKKKNYQEFPNFKFNIPSIDEERKIYSPPDNNNFKREISQHNVNNFGVQKPSEINNKSPPTSLLKEFETFKTKVRSLVNKNYQNEKKNFFSESSSSAANNQPHPSNFNNNNPNSFGYKVNSESKDPSFKPYFYDQSDYQVYDDYNSQQQEKQTDFSKDLHHQPFGSDFNEYDFDYVPHHRENKPQFQNSQNIRPFEPDFSDYDIDLEVHRETNSEPSKSSNYQFAFEPYFYDEDYQSEKNIPENRVINEKSLKKPIKVAFGPNADFFKTFDDYEKKTKTLPEFDDIQLNERKEEFNINEDPFYKSEYFKETQNQPNKSLIETKEQRTPKTTSPRPTTQNLSYSQTNQPHPPISKEGGNKKSRKTSSKNSTSKSKLSVNKPRPKRRLKQKKTIKSPTKPPITSSTTISTTTATTSDYKSKFVEPVPEIGFKPLFNASQRLEEELKKEIASQITKKPYKYKVPTYRTPILNKPTASPIYYKPIKSAQFKGNKKSNYSKKTTKSGSTTPKTTTNTTTTPSKIKIDDDLQAPAKGDKQKIFNHKRRPQKHRKHRPQQGTRNNQPINLIDRVSQFFTGNSRNGRNKIESRAKQEKPKASLKQTAAILLPYISASLAGIAGIN